MMPTLHVKLKVVDDKVLANHSNRDLQIRLRLRVRVRLLRAGGLGRSCSKHSRRRRQLATGMFQ